MIRRLRGPILILAAFASTHLWALTSARVDVESCLRLHARATAHSRTLNCLDSDAKVEILHLNSRGYSRVKVNGRVGYLWTKYLKVGAAEKTRAAENEAPRWVEPKTFSQERPEPSAPKWVEPPPRENRQPAPRWVDPNTYHPAPPTENADGFHVYWGARARNTSRWTQTALYAIRRHWNELQRARDIERFCPGYHRSTRHSQENCWLLVVAATVKAESGYNPANVTPEGRPLYYNSVGLFQLSQNRTAHECTPEGARSEYDLKNPILNLNCGIRIMASNVAMYGMLGGSSGAGAYWSSLRYPWQHRGSQYRMITGLTRNGFAQVRVAAGTWSSPDQRLAADENAPSAER